MVKQRRAGLESVRHACDIHLYHQIIGQIGVDVGQIGARDQVTRFCEIWLDEIESGAFQLLPHRPDLTLLLVAIGK
jgi:hypothetical protein